MVKSSNLEPEDEFFWSEIENAINENELSSIQLNNNETNNNTIDDFEGPKYNCKHCNKEMSNRHNLWRHENKSCKKNPNIIINKFNNYNFADTYINIGYKNFLFIFINLLVSYRSPLDKVAINFT